VRIRYTSRARDDLTTIIAYVEQHSPQGARNIAQALHKTVELIGQFPQSGGLPAKSRPACCQSVAIRILIYWSVEQDEAWIVHIRHTARRPWNPE
jgi:plasmid stabilization system protein ParE